MIHGDDPTVFLIDFGLARLYCNPTTFLHIPLTTNHTAIGTLPFASINSQRGDSQSRRDDLESLAYTIIYSVLGKLPWTGNSVRINKKAVLEKKISIMAGELCKGLPAPFCKFLTHVHSLGFKGKPDYQLLHSILSECSEAVTEQHSKAAPLYTFSDVSAESLDHASIDAGSVGRESINTGRV